MVGWSVGFSFGQIKQTVPNNAAVPVALTRERIRREYLIRQSQSVSHPLIRANAHRGHMPLTH
ncbi:hypothetical protein GCM10023156_00100 [Novipirellula rosea]|uniref:Uncharacterized protein n=1 Tax=Novipirellula rosea TaxID=1031540 RepID=A0ABP8M306_9BACT